MRGVVSVQFFPAECFRDIDGACELLDVVLGATVANNQAVVASVSDKKVRVISGVLNSTGASTKITFKSASGGTQKRVYFVPANTSASPNVILEADPFGHFETEVGQGLYLDNSAADASVSLRYFIYKPAGV